MTALPVLRAPCTCSPTVPECPACAADAAPKHNAPVTRRRILALLAPPGTWHRINELYHLAPVPQRVHTAVGVLWKQGLIRRRWQHGRYEYALREEG